MSQAILVGKPIGKAYPSELDTIIPFQDMVEKAIYLGDDGHNDFVVFIIPDNADGGRAG